MANKDAFLKKRLIRNSIIVTVITLALAGGAFLLSNFSDDTDAEKQTKTAEFTAAQSEFNALDTMLKTGIEINGYYNAYIRHHNSDFNIRRDVATQIFAALREKFHLSSVSFTIAHLTDVQEDLIKLKSGTLVKSEVTLSFSALTDNSVFGFIEGLHQNLPGIVVISGLKITRNADVSRNVLVDLSQHKITPMVSGELSFIWLGIRPKVEEKPDSSKTTPPTGSKNGK